MSGEQLGRWLSREILTRWARNGLADTHEVESPEQAGTADYRLVVSGSGSEHSRAALGFLQALTALTLPVTYTDTFEIACRLEHAETGQRFRARAEETVRRTESLLLIPALPWHQSGYRATFDVLASHLYQQLVDQGAFETAILRGSGDSERERRRRAPRGTDLRGESLPPDVGRVLAEILAETEEELARVEQATELGASYALDVDPESIKNVRRFEEVLSIHPDVLRWRGPPESSSYHIVIRRGRP